MPTSPRSLRRPRFSIGLRGQLGFSPHSARAFRFQGETYRFHVADDRVKRFLDELAAWRQNNLSSTLLSFRSDFRQVIAERPIRGLIWCAIYGQSPTRNVAIWLLGRINNLHTIRVMEQCACDPTPAVRKEVAKALRRMRAWRQLRRLADDVVPSVRRIAASAEAPATSFQQRMERFIRDDVAVRPVPGTAQKLAVLVDRLEGRPPKSAAFIRQILKRIRWLVHGQKPRRSFTWNWLGVGRRNKL